MMYRKPGNYLQRFLLATISAISILPFAAVITAQETGGDLGAGAGIFRPKNPEAKRRAKPAPRTGRPSMPESASRSTRSNPAEIEAKFEDALGDANDARDARNFSAAEASYRAALKLKARDARPYYGLGNVFVDQQRWDDAEKSYRQALEVAANNHDTLVALSFVLVQPRTGGMNAKRFTDAEYFARRATQLQPSAVAFDRLGVAMMARGIFTADTEAAFRRALELDPNLVIAQIHLASVLRHLNRAGEAEPLYKSAVERASDAATLVLIAEAMQSAQRWQDSEPVLRRALQLDARNPGALFLMGRFFAANQKYAEAEPFLKSAVEVNPKSFLARNLLARTYLGLQQFNDAFRVYEQAAELASDADRKQLAGAFGFAGVGDGYLKAGQARDAMRAYQRGLQLDPSNSELQAKLAAARAQVTP